jgi:hypothetical protein
MDKATALRHLVPALLAAVMACSTIVPAAAVERLSPVSGPWDAGKFKFADKEKKTRRAVSGIACPGKPGSGTACLVVLDEGTVAHYVTLSRNGYEIDNTDVALRDSDDELDAEAAATDGTHYFVTGSHSAKRGTCESNPGSRHLIRFAVDSTTGQARYARGQLVDYAETDALWRLMGSTPEFRDHVGKRKCLGTERGGKRGVNIEGLAVRDGTLHVGFRGPAVDGTAPILSVGATAIFEEDNPKGRITTLRLGKGRAIRDMTAINDGVLVLAGPDDDTANSDRGWILAVWDGVIREDMVVEPNVLGELALDTVALRDCDKELKPEAIAVTSDTRDSLGVVILSDGMCDGGPLKFVIRR